MSDQNKKYKIALVGICLSVGGTEKVQATLSVFFDNQNIEVHNVIFQDIISYEYSGKLLNLGLIESKTTYDKLKQLYRLRTYFLQNKFDYIIDLRGRSNSIKEILILHFVYNCPILYMVHSGLIDHYITNNNFFAKLIYSKHKIIAVSQSIRDRIVKLHNFETHTIYNLFDIDSIHNLGNSFIPKEKNYIVAVGRLNDEIKQFDKLIVAYSKSILPQNGIKLLILAEGIYKQNLINQVDKLNLNDKIIFKGFQNNPFPYQKNALFTVLASLNEGLPNVLIESLANETPVISFDCFSGPREIIINNHNGILVENQNFDQLILAMNTMIENKELYLHCKQNAKSSVEKFSIEKIGKQWLELMNIK